MSRIKHSLAVGAETGSNGNKSHRSMYSNKSSRAHALDGGRPISYLNFAAGADLADYGYGDTNEAHAINNNIGPVCSSPTYMLASNDPSMPISTSNSNVASKDP